MCRTSPFACWAHRITLSESRHSSAPLHLLCLRVFHDSLKEQAHATKRDSAVEGRTERRQRHYLNRQRNAFEHAVLVQHPFRKRGRNQSGRTRRRFPRGVFLHGTECGTREG